MIDDLRLLPKTSTAMDVAIIVRVLPDIQQAADLIEQYANTVAEGARLEAREEERWASYERTLRVMNAPLGKLEKGD